MHTQRTFAPEGQSVAQARRFVRRALEDWGAEDLSDEAVLATSELVTNAVVHAHTDVEVVLRLRPDRLRVEVIDAATDYIYRRDAAADEQSGRGMALTEALAAAWGIDALVAGKSVWFEVLRPGEGATDGDGASS